MSHESESKAKAKKPVDNETFYKILGVSKTATPEEIRSSFKKQTVRGDYRHPDRGGDAKMFTQLREAFEVLSDPERRKIYDQGGEEALKEHAQGGGHSGDPFGDIFGMFGGHRPGRQQRQGMQKLKGRRVELQVELEDVYNGKMEVIPVKRQRICLNCNGKGGDNVKKCGTCGGQGKVVRTMRMGPMIQQTIGECPDCNGEGESVDKKDQCKECKGKKVYEDNAKIEVGIDRGVPHEYDYVLTGEADELPGYMAGDLHVRIMIKKHKVFSRKGADLFIEQKISLLEALTGLSFEITHLDGAKFTVSTLPGEIIEHNAVKTVRGKGMPFWKDTISHGNLYVKFQVEFPKKGSLTKDHIAQLAKILPGPAPKELDKKTNFEYMDDFDATEVNTNPEGGHGKAGEDDDDEEGEGGHGQRVQCQQQ